MFRDAFVLLSCGAVSYLWLSVIVSPLARTARSLFRSGGDRAAWAAFALAGGGALLRTAIVIAAIVLGMMLEPESGPGLWRSELVWRGVSLGNVVWACQLIAFARVPRVERFYRLHAVSPTAPTGEAAVSGAVHGLTA